MRPSARVGLLAAAAALAVGCGARTVSGPAGTAAPTATTASGVSPTATVSRPTVRPPASVPPLPSHPTASRTASTAIRRRATPAVTPSTTRPATTTTAPAASYPVTLERVPASAAQAMTVTANGYGATVATFEAWTRSGSGWRPAYGPWTAHVGYDGIAPAGAKREGDGRTPTGVYGFSYAFGVAPDPGVHLAWRPVTGTYDVWDDDSSSPLYNEWVDGRSAAAGVGPEPMDNVPSYDEGAVIAYNTARTPGLGSAIFLHVSDGGSTAGCVSLPESELTPILRWIRPGTVISLGVV